MNIFGLEDPDLVKVDEEVTRCNVDDWQRRISIYNTENESGSAADVASAQVRQVCVQELAMLCWNRRVWRVSTPHTKAGMQTIDLLREF